MRDRARSAPDDFDDRQYPRLHADVLVRPLGALSHARRVSNLSAGGLRVFSDDEYVPGTRLALELLLPDGGTIEFAAEIVWIEKLCGAPARFDIGFKFVETTPGTMEWIRTVLAQTEE